MTIILLNKLTESGELKQLLDAGLISYRAFFYRDIYLTYDKYIKTGESKMNALNITAEKFKISYVTVYKAIRICESNRPE